MKMYTFSSGYGGTDFVVVASSKADAWARIALHCQITDVSYAEDIDCYEVTEQEIGQVSVHYP